MRRVPSSGESLDTLFVLPKFLSHDILLFDHILQIVFVLICGFIFYSTQIEWLHHLLTGMLINDHYFAVERDVFMVGNESHVNRFHVPPLFLIFIE
jgi:hypothetical protein